VPFEAVDAPFDEAAAKPALAARDARGMAEALAGMKAASVGAVDALVLGADQTLELADGRILSKPASRAELADQLRAMRGRRHWLHSAAVVVESGAPVWRGGESVALTMRPFGDAFLEAYLDAEYEQVRGGVGGYRVEGPGVQLLEKIDGSHFAVLGLPLLPLLGFLRSRGVMAS
jgi:septum formation protein